jgi:hypothetical protein
MKKTHKITTSMTLLALAFSVVALPSVASAAVNDGLDGKKTTTVTVTVPGVFTIATDNAVGISAVIGTTVTKVQTVTVTTNNTTGFALKLSMQNDTKGATQKLFHSNDTGNSCSGTYKCFNAVSTGTAIALPDTGNTWGYNSTPTNDTALTTFLPVPAYGNPASLDRGAGNTGAATDGEPIYVTFGVRMNDALPTGDYSNAVLYTATVPS